MRKITKNNRFKKTIFEGVIFTLFYTSLGVAFTFLERMQTKKMVKIEDSYAVVKIY